MTISDHKELIFNTCLGNGVEDTLQIAYVLATAGIESGYGRWMRELYNGDAYPYFENKYGRHTRIGKALGNTEVGDGAKYPGKGYVHITGKDNYRRMSPVAGVNLVANPEKAEEPAIAARILVIGMRDGMFTGKKLSDYLVTMEKCDLEGARKIVNPGEGTRRIDEFEAEFEKAITFINKMA